MRLHYLLTQDLESPSGLGRYWPLAREIARRGHQVTISALHSNFDSVREHEQIRDGVRICYVSQMHVIKDENKKEYFSSGRLIQIAMNATIALLRQALSVPTDIVHICKPHPMNGIAGLSAHGFRNRALFLDCDDYEAGSGRFISSWQQQIVRLFEKNLPRYFHHITTNTYFMKSNLISWGIPEDKIHYLPNGVDLNRFQTPDHEEVAELHNQLELNDSPVVAYIGSMSLPTHPVDLLIDAFNQVLNTIPEAILLLVGGGEDLPELQRQVKQLGIEGAVRFCGRVNPGKVAAYYALADVTVDPVYDDNAARGRSPLKLFESWACGVPMITSDVGDRKELIGDPEAGILCPPGSSLDLSKNIEAVLRDPQHYQQIVENGKRRLPLYSWDNLSAQMEKVYLSAKNS